MVDIKPINEIIKDISLYHKKEGPLAEHKLVYDSSSETLEPVYFFILDLMEEFGLAPKKLVDNFSSSPGSGHFAELGQRSTIMQQQGAKILGDVNTVLRSVLNIIYDLKEFKIRLSSYDDLNSKDKNVVEGAKLSLKQLWMDKVDYPTKGNSSIKAMALGQAGFQTLIDAFLVARDAKHASTLDLNDRVKRIILSRIEEFNSWLVQSERELRKRYELERNYLKSQVNSLKLYSRWARPYLVAASRLQSKDLGNDPNLVNVFNTLILELTLLGKQPLKIKDAALEGELPKDFLNEKVVKSFKRNYNVCILVDFKFRGIPQRVPQQSYFVFGGKSEITFRSYVLNDDELAKLDQELGKSDIADALALVEGSSGESLKQLQEEIDYFLEDKEPKKQEEKKGSSESSNPFLALIGFYDKGNKKDNKKEDKNKEIEVKKDSWLEANHLRTLAAEKGKELAFKLFEIYKKSHGMPAYT
jgi:hypothetical protein